MSGGQKLESPGTWLAWFAQFIIISVISLYESPAHAQAPAIAVSDGIASLSWPAAGYYYMLQSTTDLPGSNQWQNVATASPLTSRFAFTVPGQSNPGETAPIADPIDSSHFGVTMAIANPQQFFRLKAPTLVPVFGFAIFYAGELELTKTSDMIINGPVHANGPICVGTTVTLSFNGTVTTTNTVGGPKRDGWTPSPWNQGTTFAQGYLTNVLAFVSPLGTNDPHDLIEVPPANEDPNSSLGQSRMFNQARVLILITNLPAINTNQPTRVTVILQSSVNGLLPARDPNKQSFTFIVTNSTSITNSVPMNSRALYTNAPYGVGFFLSLTNTFTDRREYKANMYVTQIDIARYASWLSTNEFIVGKFGTASSATILYVVDQRNVGANNKLAVVRIVNGTRLPYNLGRGFTVATANPLYVKGNYNVTADGIHFAYTPGSTTNSGSCVPAALMCDAITVLSSAFNDGTSATITGTASVSNTVNAAIIAGNVPSTGTTETTFSGGAHNLTRLLEDWTGDYLVLNTSLVCLYRSQMATNQFRNPIGWSPAPLNPYYKPPTRLFSFDPNFFDPARLPPGTPVYTLP